MSWTCPECKRIFKHKNQWHSCVKVNIDVHFTDKSTKVKKIYDKLMGKVTKFGKIYVSPAKGSIMIKGKSTFLALKPRKDWLDIEFLSDREVNEYPIHKIFRVSKRRVAHSVRLEAPKEITMKLLRWIKQSYDLVNK